MKVTPHIICLQVTQTFDYEIDKKDFLQNPISWLKHLSEKNWFTKEMFKELLTLID